MGVERRGTEEGAWSGRAVEKESSDERNESVMKTAKEERAGTNGSSAELVHVRPTANEEEHVAAIEESRAMSRLSRNEAVGDIRERGKPRSDLRLSIAVAAGKLAGMTSRRLKLGGGTTLPGVVAERVDGRALEKLAANLNAGTILVTGTNGKTTTSRLLATILEHGGWRIVHNRSGANLISGLTTAMLGKSGVAGHPRADMGLFETDEAVVPSLVGMIRPKVVLITNLFRDQLDRYGEIDFIAGRWRQALEKLPSSSTVVLNVDDPAVASLGSGLKARVVRYGINVAADATAGPGHVADSKNCPVCGTALRYSAIQYAHLGSYACPMGDFERPAPDVAITSIDHQGGGTTEIGVTGPFGKRRWRISVPGLYNSYNVLAAVAGAVAVDAPLPAIDASIADFRAAFGRFERIQVGNRTLCVVLVKNPVGFSEVIRTIIAEPGERDVAILINDNLADGTDVSWLWDADIELLADRCRRVVVAGTRAGDMAVRLKYAGVPVEKIVPVDTIEHAIDHGLSGIPEDGTLYALPTYTALLELRAIAARRRYAASFWET